jgi:uncharacterized membrane protein YdbT with pleckstrin-like domain
MENFTPITEKTHPIKRRWGVVVSILFSLLVSLWWNLYSLAKFKTYHFFENYYFLKYFITTFLVILSIILLIIWLIINNFHYKFGEKHITFRRGILAKFERHIPYARIQNIIIDQNFINKLMGLWDVTLETASKGVDVLLEAKDKKYKESMIGFILANLFGKVGTRITIPGLCYENAMDIKNFLMEKIKENPLADAKAGL